jgi:hypothetical protein
MSIDAVRRAAAPASPAAAAATALSLFELRRYRTRPGRRDDLIAMFEAHFRPAYEAAGATILASWRVLDDADRWVWIRAFADGASRRRALEGFYGGSVWAGLKDACNATIADARDARLLHALAAPELAHPPPREALPAGPGRPWAITVLPLAAAEAAVAVAAATEARFTALGAPAALALASERDAVLLRRFETPEAEAAFHTGAAGREALRGLPAGSRHWRLMPTACSRLR